MAEDAVLLEGPVGCGKTALVQQLAWMTGRRAAEQLITVQLGDQTDAKVVNGLSTVLICDLYYLLIYYA